MKSLGIAEILFIFCFHSKQWCCESFQHLRIKGYIKWKLNLLFHLPKALANMIYLRGNINTPSSTSRISAKQMCFQSAMLLKAFRYNIYIWKEWGIGQWGIQAAGRGIQILASTPQTFNGVIEESNGYVDSKLNELFTFCSFGGAQLFVILGFYLNYTIWTSLQM